MKRFLTTLVSLALATSSVLAQGANDCANAQPIAGEGLFAFDNNGATIDGPADCNGQPVRRDVWFEWTPPMTGGYIFSTCSQTTLATRIAAYGSTSCPPTNFLGCNVGGCNLQSTMGFTATAGVPVLLRVGSRNVGDSGNGNFRLEFDPCPSLPDDNLEENDTCLEAVPTGDVVLTNQRIFKNDDDWFLLDVNPGGTLTLDVTFTHSNGDIDIFLFDGCGGSQLAVSGSASDNEQIVYTNATANCQRVYFQINHWLPDTNSNCNDYSVSIAGTGSCSIGTNYCTASAHSGSANGAPISALGSANVSAQDVQLIADNLPLTGGGNGVPGLFFFGTTQLGGVPFGDGLRCVGGSQARVQPPTFGGGGMGSGDPPGPSDRATRQVDFSAGYASGIVGGASLNFQFWFRDPVANMAGFNTTDAINIMFQ